MAPRSNFSADIAQMANFIHKNKDSLGNIIKPYEECRAAKITGRWYGLGYVERVLALTEYLNTVINLRLNKSRVSQLGLFKIRKGSGITPQSLAKLSANGAITVQTMDDIEQMVMQDSSPASYRDEENVMNWSRQVTGAFEAVTGETLPSSTTATIGAIQNRNATSQFSLIKKGIGMFLERVTERQFMPIIFKNLKRSDVVQYYPEHLESYDKLVVATMMYEAVKKIDDEGGFVDPIQVAMEEAAALEKLQGMGDQRFVEVLDSLEVTDYYVDVQVTNEDYDTGVMVQNLLTALQAAPEYRAILLPEIFDKMGIGPFKAPQLPPQIVPPTGVGQQDPTEVTAQANTGEAFGKAQALTQMSYGG